MWEKSKEPSSFRMFIIKMWADHAKERRGYGEEPLDFKDYFYRYKNWLKEIYKNG